MEFIFVEQFSVSRKVLKAQAALTYPFSLHCDSYISVVHKLQLVSRYWCIIN